jgi:hypothetical protein
LPFIEAWGHAVSSPLLRLIGLAGIVGLATLICVSSSDAAAPPHSRLEHAKTQATIIYRKYSHKAFDASLFAGKGYEAEAAKLYKQYNAALDAAVELDPHVQRAMRAYKRAERDAEKNPDDDPDAPSRRLEDLQIIRQQVRLDIGQEIFERVEDPNWDPDTATPVPPAGSWSAEALAYGGGVSADSFGTNYQTGIFGGRAAFGLALPSAFRLQFDLEGEKTGSYCAACGDRGEVAYGGHLDWKIAPRFDIGAFGGAQYVQPTFNAPSNTNYFAGFEARYNAGWWMAGAQTGYFDVARGPGTLDRAWFFEGRAKIALGRAFGSSSPFNPVLGLSAGHGSGNLSNSLLSADTTYWSVTLSQRFSGTPITGFVGFHKYINRTELRGTVWDENIIKGGIKVDFSNGVATPPAVETSQPLPFLLRTVATF